jgi:hypothetical protein
MKFTGETILHLQVPNTELVRFDTAENPSYMSLQISISGFVSEIRDMMSNSSGSSLKNALPWGDELDCYIPKKDGVLIDAYKIAFVHDPHRRLKRHVLMSYTSPRLHHLRNPSLKWTMEEPTHLCASDDIRLDHHAILEIGQRGVLWVHLPGNDRLWAEVSTVLSSIF